MLPLRLTLCKSRKMDSTQLSNELIELDVLGNTSNRCWSTDFVLTISSIFEFMLKPSSNKGFRQKFLVPLRARKLSRFRSECNICDSSCFKISFGIEKSRSELSREFRDVVESESKFEFKSLSNRNFLSCWSCIVWLKLSSLTSSGSKLGDFDVLDPYEWRFWVSEASLM